MTQYFHFSGVLLPEIVTCLVLLQLQNPAVLQSSKALVVLDGILDILDKFNKLAPGLDRDDKDDLSWPGFCGEYSFFSVIVYL